MRSPKLEKALAGQPKAMRPGPLETIPGVIAGSPTGHSAVPFHERVAAAEERWLSPLATRSYPATRRRPEPDARHRTPFQRDRDRIVHCKAFRRLKHKTQVFIAPEGDHYRTRLTHTLEACGIARNVARALGLNEDLTEAIGLGHDLGHPPFGHVGESVLDDCLRERYGVRFRHNEHSLRVVEHLERDGAGLNLTEQVRDGILHHTGDGTPATLEGRIVRVVDRIAYINHDIDDALRAGVIDRSDLPLAEIEALGETGSERIETLVCDLVDRSAEAGDIVQGEDVGGAMLRLREFMFGRVYLGPAAQSERPRIERLLRGLFEHYAEHPPPAIAGDSADHQRVVDYLAGMTDRFAIRAFSDLALPQGY
jgi:dGTPase